MFELEKFTRKKVLAQAVAVALGLTPFLPGCGGGGGGGDNTGGNNPGGDNANGYSITAVGGTTTGTQGGLGGTLSVYSTRGNAEILTTGRASAQISITQPTMDFGANKLTVSGDALVVAASTTPGQYAWYVSGTNQLLASADNNPAPNGTLYIYAGTLRHYTGDVTTDAVITGIEVAKGVTLTINDIALSGANGPRFTLANDIYNQGTITVGEASGLRGPLLPSANNYFGAAGSVLTTAGDAGAPAGGLIYLILTGGFYNAGAINVSGASSLGGTGGRFVVSAGTAVANRGDVNLNGGDATGYGGNAGSLSLYGADVVNSGTITGHGGSGTLGGRGASVTFDASCDASDGYGGDAYNEGALHLEGGSASGSVSGGRGGSFTACSRGGKLVMNADIDARGGAITGTSGNGGAGGDIYLGTGDDRWAYGGDVLVSGNLNLNGGAGGRNAGPGGYLSAGISAYGGTARLALLGYSAIDVSGGNGELGYGGGSVSLQSANSVARNQVAIRAHGGAGAYGGGTGGTFSAYGNNIENSAEVEVSGDTLSQGGEIMMSAETDVTNTGALKANGGANAPDVSTAARGGGITLTAGGKVTSSGGSYAAGGNATGTGSVGGIGGSITYTSSGTGMTTTYSGVLSVAGGTGETAGTEGCTTIDGTTLTTGCIVR